MLNRSFLNINRLSQCTVAMTPLNGKFRCVKYAIKAAIKSGLDGLGIEIRRNRGGAIGTIADFLENIRTRGFVPRGIIDIGANRGDWTRLALSIFPDASVIMIEPQDEMQPYLSKLCSSVANCQHVKAGAGRAAGADGWLAARGTQADSIIHAPISGPA